MKVLIRNAHLANKLRAQAKKEKRSFTAQLEVILEDHFNALEQVENFFDTTYSGASGQS